MLHIQNHETDQWTAPRIMKGNVKKNMPILNFVLLKHQPANNIDRQMDWSIYIERKEGEIVVVLNQTIITKISTQSLKCALVTQKNSTESGNMVNRWHVISSHTT